MQIRPTSNVQTSSAVNLQTQNTTNAANSNNSMPVDGPSMVAWSPILHAVIHKMDSSMANLIVDFIGFFMGVINTRLLAVSFAMQADQEWHGFGEFKQIAKF